MRFTELSFLWTKLDKSTNSAENSLLCLICREGGGVSTINCVNFCEQWMKFVIPVNAF